jgi:hypothetical protein
MAVPNSSPRASVGVPVVGGIRNQAFRIPKNKKWLCERFDSETPGAADFFSIVQILRFGQYPSSPAKQLNEPSIAQSVNLAWQSIPRRNLWDECCSPREPRPGIRSGGFVVPNT